jgi:hypothetical protein
MWLHPVDQNSTVVEIQSKFSVTGMGLCPLAAISDGLLVDDSSHGLLCVQLLADGATVPPASCDVNLLTALCSNGGGVCTTIQNVADLSSAIRSRTPAVIHITHCDMTEDGFTPCIRPVFDALTGKGCRQPFGFVVGIVVNVMLPGAGVQSRLLLEACDAMFVLTWKRISGDVCDRSDEIRHRMVSECHCHLPFT